MWRIAACAKLAVIGLGLGVVFGLTQPAAAIDSVVAVRICDDDSVGVVTIVAPTSDTVYHQSPLDMTVSTEFVNQVDIYVNDVYQKVVAIPAGQTAIDTTVRMVEGTQNIEVRGVGLCDGVTVRASIVVTYDPPDPPEPPVTPTEPGDDDQTQPTEPKPTEPSVGAETPTVVGPTTPSAGGGVVVSNPNPTEPDDTTSGVSWRGFIDWIGRAGWFDWNFRFTDIDAETQRASADWLRVLVFIAGVGSLTIAGFGLQLNRRRRIILLVAGSLLLLLSVLIFL